MIETLQQVRFVVLYPAIATFGLFWAAVFWLRFRRGRCVGDFWAGTLAMAMGDELGVYAGYAGTGVGAVRGCGCDDGAWMATVGFGRIGLV